MAVATKELGVGGSSSLLLMDVPTETDTSSTPSIRGLIPRKEAKALLSVQVLPSDGRRKVIISESSPKARMHRVVLFDSAAIGSRESAPLRTFNTETMTTVLKALPTNSALTDSFAAGSSDGTVSIWDVRQSRVALKLHRPASAAAAMINSLDVRGTLFLAGNVDSGVVLWDMRMAPLGSAPPPEPTGRGIVREFYVPQGVSKAIFVGDAGDLCWSPAVGGLRLARALTQDTVDASGEKTSSSVFTELAWIPDANLLVAATERDAAVDLFAAN